MKNKMPQKVFEAIRNFNSFCITGHVRPDGDCIGSQLALTLPLQKAGKSVTCWNDDPVPGKLLFLDPTGVVQPPQPDRAFDCVIALDCATLERMGRTEQCVRQRQLLVNIDHHTSNSRYGDVNWIDDKKASTGELVYDFLRTADWPITPGVADCLFTAVSTDTGSFQYPSTRPSTFLTASHLVERGANLGRVCHEVYQSYPLSRMRLLKRVYNRFRLTHSDRTAYFWLKPADYAQTGSKPADSEGLIDHIRAIDEVVVACVFEEVEPGLTRVSLRSKDREVNVNEIANQFGGGGHPAAAGARVTGKALAVQRRVLSAIRKALAKISQG